MTKYRITKASGEVIEGTLTYLVNVPERPGYDRWTLRDDDMLSDSVDVNEDVDIVEEIS